MLHRIREKILYEENLEEINFGFHYSSRLDTIEEVAEIMSVFKEWPEEGAYFDQDWFLIQDALKWQSISNNLKESLSEVPVPNQKYRAETEDWTNGQIPTEL